MQQSVIALNLNDTATARWLVHNLTPTHTPCNIRTLRRLCNILRSDGVWLAPSDTTRVQTILDVAEQAGVRVLRGIHDTESLWGTLPRDLVARAAVVWIFEDGRGHYGTPADAKECLRGMLLGSGWRSDLRTREIGQLMKLQPVGQVSSRQQRMALIATSLHQIGGAE